MAAPDVAALIDRVRAVLLDEAGAARTIDPNRFDEGDYGDLDDDVRLERALLRPLVDVEVLSLAPSEARPTGVGNYTLHDILVRVSVTRALDTVHKVTPAERHAERAALQEDLFLVAQALSYPGNLPDVGLVSDLLQEDGIAAIEVEQLDDELPPLLRGAVDFRGWIRTIFPVAADAGWYVDAVEGSDANGGRSPEDPLQTIAGLQSHAILEGETIHLARGSRWREQLGRMSGQGTELPPGCEVKAYGTGARPILDAFDVASAGDFAPVPGRANTYSIDWTPEMDAPETAAFVMLEDDVGLVWVADEATVDATPGSYTAPDPSGAGTYQILVHPRGSTNPTADGKTYEIGSRYGGLAVNSGTAREIHTRGNLHNNGSLWSSAEGLIVDCVASWGHKHAVFTGGGRCIRTVAWGTVDVGGTGSTIPFVAYAGSGAGVHALFEDCIAIITPESGGVPLLDPALNVSGAFFAHTSDTDPSTWFASVTMRRCGAVYSAGAFSTGDTEDTTYEDCIHEKMTQGVPFRAEMGTCVIRGCRAYGGIHAGRNLIRAFGSGGGAAAICEDSIITSAATSGSLFFAGGAHELRRCVIASENRTAYSTVFDRGSVADCTDNLIVAPWDAGFSLEAGETVATSDRNVWPAAVDMRVNGGTQYFNFAAYQAGEAPLDANSVGGTPTFEAEADPERPIYVEADASPTAGVASGPTRTWVLPHQYEDWIAFMEAGGTGTMPQP